MSDYATTNIGGLKSPLEQEQERSSYHAIYKIDPHLSDPDGTKPRLDMYIFNRHGSQFCQKTYEDWMT